MTFLIQISSLILKLIFLNYWIYSKDFLFKSTIGVGGYEIYFKKRWNKTGIPTL